jgi:tetratricopeptide (TPR) repeat protein
MKLVTLLLALVVAACGGTKAETKPDPIAKAEAAPKAETAKPAATKEDSVQALIADAGKLLKDGKAQDAKAKYATALKRDPKNFDARVGMANADIKLGNYDEAKSSLQALQKEKPDSREVVILLGVLAKEKGDYAGGIELYKDALDKQEKAGEAPDPDLLNNMIVLYRLNKEYEDAEKTCRKLLSRDPNNVDALKNLSLIYFDQEKYALAETIAINSLKLNDKDAALYNNRGMIRLKQYKTPNYPQAVGFFKKALEIDPNNISAHLNLGAIALRYRDYNTAAQHYGEALKLEPKQPEANLGLGFALAGQQKPDEAIRQLQRALEINPNAVEAYGEIAEVTNLQLNKPKDALDWCGKYKDAKGGKVDDKDPVGKDCTNIEQTLKNQEKMKQMAEAAKAAAAEDDKNKPKPAGGAAPANGAAPPANGAAPPANGAAPAPAAGGDKPAPAAGGAAPPAPSGDKPK